MHLTHSVLWLSLSFSLPLSNQLTLKHFTFAHFLTFFLLPFCIRDTHSPLQLLSFTWLTLKVYIIMWAIFSKHSAETTLRISINSEWDTLRRTQRRERKGSFIKPHGQTGQMPPGRVVNVILDLQPDSPVCFNTTLYISFSLHCSPDQSQWKVIHFSLFCDKHSFPLQRTQEYTTPSVTYCENKHCKMDRFTCTWMNR